MAAPKTRISFVCQECGYDTPKFMGKCPECGNWNSFKEFRETVQRGGANGPSGMTVLSDQILTPQALSSISFSENERIVTGFGELDTVLGGGLVRGGAVLLAGDPGIGKSTLLLQMCLNLAGNGQKVLYVSGEESAEQITMRADRLTARGTEKRVKSGDNLLLLSLADVDAAILQIQNVKPALIVVDSIQTLESQNAGGLAGSVGQIRYAAMHLIRVAKALGIPLILVGHVTKEGMVAGPMVLSHMVDTVLFLEGEKTISVRILRSFKNRFGPVDEVGIFRMDETGMQEVSHPEQLFLTAENASTPGSVITATLEGTRAFLVELQGLTVYSKMPMPRRVVSGLDQRRVELLLAVLQKHARLPFDTTDVFVNVAGGLKLSDPGVDLGVCLAVFSSLKNIPLPKTVGIGEVGLLGELRNVPGSEKRVREAKKLGYKRIITPETHKTLKDVLEFLSKSEARNPKSETNPNT
jgi:DNA repair protein RadA/Sms